MLESTFVVKKGVQIQSSVKDMSQPTSEIKVFVVDDSVFFRTNITKILEDIPDIKVVGLARNGLDALNKLNDVKPDVILLDFFMPKMDGLQFLKTLMERSPTPTIMITSADKGEHADIYFEAIRLGAFDILSKPQGGDALNLSRMKTSLEERIRFAAKIIPRVSSESSIFFTPKVKPLESVAAEKTNRTANKLNKLTDHLLIIGASAGGPKAIFQVLSSLRYMPGLTICVIQHMPEEFTKSFALRIDDVANYRAKEAENGELLKTGWIYVAPGNRHMEINCSDEGLVIEVNQKPRLHGCRPSVDVFMKSVLKFFDPQRIIGVLLTGMGDDGAAGLLLIKEKGGITISQDKETSEIWGMPKKAVELDAVQHILPLSEISTKLNSILIG